MMAGTSNPQPENTQEVRRSKRSKPYTRRTKTTASITTATAPIANTNTNITTSREKRKKSTTESSSDTTTATNVPTNKRRRSSRVQNNTVANPTTTTTTTTTTTAKTSKRGKSTAALATITNTINTVTANSSSNSNITNDVAIAKDSRQQPQMTPSILVEDDSDGNESVEDLPHLRKMSAAVHGLLDEAHCKTICQNLRRREGVYGVTGSMLGSVTNKMWAILIDWMIEVQVNFQLGQNCLFLGVNILGRFFRKAEVDRSELQLAGAAALLIASKHEEINPREIADYVYICADTYLREDIIKMERKILCVLDYKLCAPLASNFMMRYSLHCSVKEQNLATFLLELTLQDFRFSFLPPSLVVAGSIYLAGMLCNRQVWTGDMSEELGYGEATIVQCSKLINQHATEEQEFEDLTTCRDKYSDPRFSEVGKIRLQFVFPTNDDAPIASVDALRAQEGF